MNSEHTEQVNFVNWFEYQHPGVLIFAIPNGGARHIVAAKKLKAEGVKKGIPDLCVPAWNLWIEMKREKGGKLSKEQKEIKAYLESIGHTVIVGHGFKDAKEKVDLFKQLTGRI